MAVITADQIDNTAPGETLKDGATKYNRHEHDALVVTVGTITTQKAIVDGTVIWNAAGVTFTAWKLNITDTASAAASLLFDLQKGGTSYLKVDRLGIATLSQAGSVLQLSNADSQILVGTTTDPGWLTNAIQLDRATFYRTGTSALTLAFNAYFDNIDHRAVATDVVAFVQLTNERKFRVYSAPSTTAGAVPTLTEFFQIDSNTTAAETALLLSVAGGAIARVSVGAADSGGTGFRYLRVPN